MRETALRCAVGVPNRGDLEELPVGALPISNRGFWVAIATPKEIARVGLGPGWNVSQSISDEGGKWKVNGSASFRSIEENSSHVIYTGSFEGDGIPNCETAIPHQPSQSPKARRIVLHLSLVHGFGIIDVR